MTEEKSGAPRFAGEALAVGLLLVLFCAFFALGFVAGQSSAVKAAALGSDPAPAPAAERLVWRTARN